ncbi:MAG: phosphoglycolate phosphatase [Succinivibrionaceae bacterium]|nr:phosphoglycolate phosphatase [Succinivibrionaceae bacterium]
MPELPALPRALLFDLDGTLADTLPALALAAQRACRDLGIEPEDERTIGRYVGNGVMMLLERAMEHRFGVDLGSCDQGRLARARERFNEHYAQGLGTGFALYPGVREALLHFRSLGIALAVVTNKPQAFAVPLIGHMGLSDCFDYVLGGEVLPERKPSPLPLLTACRELGVEPSATLMVGDSDNDILAGANAGMRTIFLTFGYYYGDISACKPTYILGSYQELVGLIDSAPRDH